ncbi:MAG: ABC transporter substrate-binding protein [Candidatus Babeliales bacterium]|nr:ABC transporter substrate-binding protein [Candidatus Babeliales bacterium]
MKRINILLMISVMGAIIVSFIIFKPTSKINKKTRYTIGIVQTASHPALDAVREGFIEELKKSIGSDVSFIIRNGEGSIANIATIAQQFHNDKNINGIFAIATPAAQAIATVEQNRPIFIAAVTDPQALGLIHPTTNVTGTKDMIDISAQIDMLVKLLPNAKTVGLIYNNGEVNSIAFVNIMRTELKNRGLMPIDFAVSSESDLPTAAQMAFLKSDVVLAPTDNMVASSIALLASLAHKNKKPLIVSDNMLVEYGALASRGVDYKESGKQTAQIAHHVLIEGKKPHEIAIQQAKSNKIYINKNSLTTLKLSIPESLNNHSILVG